MGKRQQQQKRERRLRRERMTRFFSAFNSGANDLISVKGSRFLSTPTTSMTIGCYGRTVHVSWNHGSYLLKRAQKGEDYRFMRCPDLDKAVGRTKRWLLQGLI